MRRNAVDRRGRTAENSGRTARGRAFAPPDGGGLAFEEVRYARQAVAQPQRSRGGFQLWPLPPLKNRVGNGRGDIGSWSRGGLCGGGRLSG